MSSELVLRADHPYTLIWNDVISHSIYPLRFSSDLFERGSLSRHIRLFLHFQQSELESAVTLQHFIPNIPFHLHLITHITHINNVIT